jgi:hypothetical protein
MLDKEIYSCTHIYGTILYARTSRFRDKLEAYTATVKHAEAGAGRLVNMLGCGRDKL